MLIWACRREVALGVDWPVQWNETDDAPPCPICREPFLVADLGSFDPEEVPRGPGT